MERLQHLELIDMPVLKDEHFAAIDKLRCLTTLSVVAVGNVNMTHAALQHITDLKHLRLLRWHVGDNFDPLPDVQSLARLTSLISLCVPNSLNAQMDRWGAYSILNEMPLCDVSIEGSVL